MFKFRAKGRLGRKTAPVFNFFRFEKQLDRLRQQGVNVISDDYPVRKLKKYKNLRYFFEHFSEQQIKTQLIFYAKQFEEQAR